jgi:hypothetical protein
LLPLAESACPAGGFSSTPATAAHRHPRSSPMACRRVRQPR